jgi:hypothetical protein
LADSPELGSAPQGAQAHLELMGWRDLTANTHTVTEYIGVQNCTLEPVPGVENLSLRLGFLVITSFCVRVLSLRKIENPEKR